MTFFFLKSLGPDYQSLLKTILSGSSSRFLPDLTRLFEFRTSKKDKSTNAAHKMILHHPYFGKIKKGDFIQSEQHIIIVDCIYDNIITKEQLVTGRTIQSSDSLFAYHWFGTIAEPTQEIKFEEIINCGPIQQWIRPTLLFQTRYSRTCHELQKKLFVQ